MRTKIPVSGQADESGDYLTGLLYNTVTLVLASNSGSIYCSCSGIWTYECHCARTEQIVVCSGV